MYVGDSKVCWFFFSIRLSFSSPFLRSLSQVVLFETRVPKKPQIVTFKVRPILDVDAE